MIRALFVYIIASAGLASLVLILVLVLGTNHPETEKLSAYECGFEPFSRSRQTFDVRFYLIGLMFLIFDVEIAFLFPGSVLVLTGSKVIIGLILVFSLILILGFVLEMKVGVLDGKGKTSLLSCVSPTSVQLERRDSV